MTAAGSATTGLAASDISVRFGGRDILRGITLAAHPGQILAVAGPNGAGKSTLLRVLAGLAIPHTGSIIHDGRPLHSFDRRALGRRIAYLPQDRIVHWPLTVETVVALGRLPHGPGGALGPHDREAIDAALLETDAIHLRSRIISDLSGGERARILIARALAQQADVLIADEPSAGLDPAHALSLFETFTRIAAGGRTIVVALHDLTAALRYCDSTALLKGGHCSAFGATRDVLTEANIASVYGVRALVTQVAGVPVIIPVGAVT